MRQIPARLAQWLLLLAFAAPGCAQIIEQDVERVDAQRPEGWALSYASAVTVFGGFGVTSALEPGTLIIGAEAGHVPSVPESQTRVGFDGVKFEDLNKAPLFGRLRLWYALPWGIVAEVGWTPPLTVKGVRADNLVAIALGRALWAGERWRFGARLYAQDGSVTGDITCSGANVAAGPFDQRNNPFQCRSPSRDDVDLDQYGAELSAEWTLREAWSLYGSYAATRITPQIQVHAEVFENVLDRSIVKTRTTLDTYSVGVIHRGPLLEVLLAAAYTPLDVRRPPDRLLESDDMLSARIMARIPWP